MKIRTKTLWKVPVFCAVASFFTFHLTVYFGAPFYTVETVGADGITVYSADPVRSAVFTGTLFVIALLLGGLWAFRSMTRAEIAASAVIASAVYMLIALAQMYLPGIMAPFGIWLSYFQNWINIASSFLLTWTGYFRMSILLANFVPLLFIPFGKKAVS